VSVGFEDVDGTWAAAESTAGCSVDHHQTAPIAAAKTPSEIARVSRPWPDGRDGRGVS
jgi:hypothetical protein